MARRELRYAARRLASCGGLWASVLRHLIAIGFLDHPVLNEGAELQRREALSMRIGRTHEAADEVASEDSMAALLVR